MFRPDLRPRNSLPYGRLSRPLTSSIVRNTNYQTINPNYDHRFLRQLQMDKKRYAIISHDIPKQLLNKHFVKVDQKVNYGRALTRQQLARVIDQSKKKKPLVETIVYGDPKRQIPHPTKQSEPIKNGNFKNDNIKIDNSKNDKQKTKTYVRQPIDIKVDQKTTQFCDCGSKTNKKTENITIDEKLLNKKEQKKK